MTAYCPCLDVQIPFACVTEFTVTMRHSVLMATTGQPHGLMSHVYIAVSNTGLYLTGVFNSGYTAVTQSTVQ